MITKRLRTVANLINDANIVADIGTDHAYLPITLILEKRAKQAYAVDVNKEPLEWAKKNINKYNLENQIHPILSDGLSFLNQDSNTNVDYVTICGLGTPTIYEILKEDNIRISRYIICSNTEISLIRKWVYENSYSLLKEQFLIDNQKNYWLCVIEKNQENLINEIDIKFGNKLFNDKNIELIDYLENEIIKFEKIVSSLDKEKHAEVACQLENEIKEIGKYINEIK